MAFDTLPTETQRRMVESYCLGSVTSWLPLADEHQARQFFRTLDAATLALWME